MKQTSIALFIALVVIGCSQKKNLSKEELQAYESEVNAWHTKRIENVKAPDGWLNLAGLFWLKPGVNTFGSSEKNAIVFPEGKIAKEAGYFTVSGATVSLHVNKGVTITREGEPVTEQIIFSPDSVKPVSLVSGSLQWNIIKRDSRLGIRLRDHDSEQLKTFTGVERYPINPEYRAEARFEKYDSTRSIEITNVLGQTTPQNSPGALVFTLQGTEHRLDVLEGNTTEFFVIFADATSGTETYTGGRFLYVKKPADKELIYVDFNKAYNPPCVFTPYATCPLPPKQNILTIEVRAGEKNYAELGGGLIDNQPK